ncbi:MAG: hypothetical protein K0U64_02840 [Actinomycetia bacterium]|nr:hypothetical protein [Actinomycetes bacterium]
MPVDLIALRRSLAEPARAAATITDRGGELVLTASDDSRVLVTQQDGSWLIQEFSAGTETDRVAAAEFDLVIELVEHSYHRLLIAARNAACRAQGAGGNGAEQAGGTSG